MFFLATSFWGKSATFVCHQKQIQPTVVLPLKKLCTRSPLNILLLFRRIKFIVLLNFGKKNKHMGLVALKPNEYIIKLKLICCYVCNKLSKLRKFCLFMYYFNWTGQFHSIYPEEYPEYGAQILFFKNKVYRGCIVFDEVHSFLYEGITLRKSYT